MNLEFWVCWASCQFCFSGLCRPNDSRMLVALGECYEKLNQLVEAKKVRGVRFTVEKQVGPYVTTQITARVLIIIDFYVLYFRNFWIVSFWVFFLENELVNVILYG